MNLIHTIPGFFFLIFRRSENNSPLLFLTFLERTILKPENTEGRNLKKSETGVRL